LVASFGSYGIYAFDLDGNLIWEKDLGRMATLHGHGEGGSPVLHEDRVIVNWDHEGPSFIVALDKWTGDRIWKKDRDEVTSWATPVVIEHEGRDQAVVSGTNRVRGYDLETGEVLWECGGLSSNVVASPVAGDGRVFAGSSYEIRSLLAIQLEGAHGDITGSDHVLWKKDRGTPYVPSPLLFENHLYYLHHYQGVLSKVRADSGEEEGPFRLDGIRNVYSSPVGAAGRIYVTDRSGKTIVIAHQTEPGILALNELEDTFSASAAVVGDEIFLRGEKSLYCISRQ